MLRVCAECGLDESMRLVSFFLLLSTRPCHFAVVWSR